MDATPIPAAPKGPSVRLNPATKNTLEGVGEWKVNMSLDDDTDPPLYSQRRQTALRFVVLLAIAALILPGLVITWSTQLRTAQYACEIAVAYYAPGATSSRASFDLFPAELVGWNCYAVMFDNQEYFVAHLGVIPGAPRLVPLTGS
jgi:hypothetical protein